MSYTIQSLKYIFHRYIISRKFLNAADTVFNLNFRVQTPDAMGRRIYKRGSLHPEHVNFFLSLPFQDDDVILDIGANIGWYSIVLRKNITRNVSIYAFEPEPLNFELLEKNVATNHAQVKPVNKAVAEKAGHLTLFLYHAKNSGRHSLLDINQETNKSIQVETVRLDDFLERENIDPGRVKFVKIDIEGYEFFALKGAVKLMEKLPYMFLEFSPASIRKGGQDPADFIRWLAQFQFNFYNIDDGKPAGRDLNYLTSSERTENLFLVKKDRDKFHE